MVDVYELELDEARNVRLCKERGIDYNNFVIENPVEVVNMIDSCFHIRKKAEERMYLVCMRSNGTVLGIFEMSHGSFDEAFCGIKELFTKVLLLGAIGFVLVHNHPSGSVKPSSADKFVCHRVSDASRLMDVNFHDFIIIGEGYCSFREEGLLE